MKTSSTEQALQNANIKRETFKIEGDLSRFTKASPSQGTIKIFDRFNSLLANEYALFTKTLNFHWNVTGPRFHSVHQFLEDQYNSLLKVVDDVAERIREIGGQPMGTLTEMQSKMSIKERPGFRPETSDMIADLLSDHESIQVQIKSLLKEIESGESDPGSEDFLTSLLKQHEEMAWMLKSHIH